MVSKDNVISFVAEDLYLQWMNIQGQWGVTNDMELSVSCLYEHVLLLIPSDCVS
jgi:hypothetical protein